MSDDLSQLFDDMLFEVTRTLRVPRDYYALASVSKRFATLLWTPVFRAPMEIACFEPWRYVCADGMNLGRLPTNQMTEEVCIAAVQNRGCAIRYVFDEHQTENMCLVAVQESAWALEFITEEKRTMEICLIAVRRAAFALRNVPLVMRTAELCLIAVQQHGDALQLVPDELKTVELCRVAVQERKSALEFVPRHIRLLM
jgi:hypothetical protein